MFFVESSIMCTRKQISQLSGPYLLLDDGMGPHLDLDSLGPGWASELGLDLGEP